MKDTRLTPKQIDRLLANNPQKIVLETQEKKDPAPQRISFGGNTKEYDVLKSIDHMKNFCEFIREVISHYEENQRLQEEAETKEMDLKHCMELAQKLTEKEKKQLYSKLTDVLQERRTCKAENEILQPLYNSFKDKALLNKLSQIQGTVANVKESVQNRTYYCRTSVLDDFRIESMP